MRAAARAWPRRAIAYGVCAEGLRRRVAALGALGVSMAERANEFACPFEWDAGPCLASSTVVQRVVSLDEAGPSSLRRLQL